MSDEKRYDGSAILGEVSGLGKVEVQKIWTEVKANSALLKACAGPHDFQRTDGAALGAKFTCSKCGGTLRSVEVGWYEAGLAHGRAERI